MKKKFHFWTPRDIIFLKKNYPTKGGPFCARELGRTIETVWEKARILRIERKGNIIWQKDEIEYMKKWYGKKRPKEIAHKLGRNTAQVVKMAQKLGLRTGRVKPWTPREENYVIANFRKMLYQDIARELGRTRGSIVSLLTRLKMRKNGFHRWTGNDRRYIGRMYKKKMTAARLAQHFGVRKPSVQQMVRRMGLTRNTAVRFTLREMKLIRANYHTMRHEDLARKVKRTVGSIEAWARRHGLTRKK